MEPHHSFMALTKEQGETMGQLPTRLCSKPFGERELEIVRSEIDRSDPPLRVEIARRVCVALQWVDIVGKLKLMSARKALLRLHRDGYIQLPPPRNGNGNRKPPVHRNVDWPSEDRLEGSAGELNDLRLEAVEDKISSRLFNALVDKVLASK
jgi:hypothetical protein